MIACDVVLKKYYCSNIHVVVAVGSSASAEARAKLNSSKYPTASIRHKPMPRPRLNSNSLPYYRNNCTFVATKNLVSRT